MDEWNNKLMTFSLCLSLKSVQIFKKMKKPTWGPNLAGPSETLSKLLSLLWFFVFALGR